MNSASVSRASSSVNIPEDDSRLMSTPLDPARPRWQFHLVDNYDGGSAVIARIHHCYADGIALVRVMLSMTDATAKGPPAMPFEPRERTRADPDDALGQLLAPIEGVLASARKIGGTLIEKGAAIWQDPAKAVALADKGSALTSCVARNFSPVCASTAVIAPRTSFSSFPTTGRSSLESAFILSPHAETLPLRPR